MIGVGLGLLEARWWYFLFPGGRGHWDSHRFCPTLPPAPAGVVYYTAASPPPPKCFQALLVQTLCGCCCNQITSPQMPDSPLSTPQITPTPSEANNTMCLENRRCSSGPSAYRLDSVIWTERLLEFSLCKSRLGHMLRLDCGGGGSSVWKCLPRNAGSGRSSSWKERRRCQTLTWKLCEHVSSGR